MFDLICPCVTCVNRVVSSEYQRAFINHVRQHINFNQLSIPFNCGQYGCSKSLVDMKMFSTHLNRDHKNDASAENHLTMSKHLKLDETSLNEDPINEPSLLNEEVLNTSAEETCLDHSEDDTKNIFNQVKIKAFDLINLFRSKNQLSASLLNEIIELFGDFFYDLVEIISSKVFEFLSSENTKTILSKFFKKMSRPFDHVSTSYKQQKCLEQTGFYIAPKSIDLCTRDDVSIRKGTSILIPKCVTFEYISVFDTIKMLLENEDFKSEYFQFSSSNNEYYENHVLFKNEKNIRILMYYDDLEMCNGLGDVASIYKAGMFYFTIANLTRKHYSNLKNIFLTAICHSDDLKSFGYNQVLTLIISDVRKLETIGIKVGSDTLYGSIAQCLGDNLGLHQIFGINQR